MDSDTNEIRIKTTAFYNIFRVAQNIILTLIQRRDNHAHKLDGTMNTSISACHYVIKMHQLTAPGNIGPVCLDLKRIGRQIINY